LAGVGSEVCTQPPMQAGKLTVIAVRTPQKSNVMLLKSVCLISTNISVIYFSAFC